jgi:hypothetical protein
MAWCSCSPVCMAGDWRFSHADQRVDLSGGGYCGWTASADFPAAINPDDHPGTWALKLKLAPTSTLAEAPVLGVASAPRPTDGPTDSEDAEASPLQAQAAAPNDPNRPRNRGCHAS